MSRLTQWIDRRLVHVRARVAISRRPQRILFVHIAKTAGTSLRRMMQEEFGSYLVYPGDVHLRQLPNRWYPLGSEILRDFAKVPPHNVLVGHFTAAMADMLPCRYQVATFLREPVQRSLSVLGHFSRMLGIPATALLDDPAFMSQHVSDFQTRVLGADGICDPHRVQAVDDAALARAMERVDTLDFVGLTERFHESCALFDERFRTGMSRLIRRDAVNRPEGSELSEHIPRLMPLLGRDRALHERAALRLDSRK
jgi:hypothetical protein